jgi:NlpC/P60 family putative phage cell wall peptidase
MVNWSRQDVVKEALSWEGTPYHHQAHLKNVGVDCAGLITGVYGAITGTQPVLPKYSPRWAEANTNEMLLLHARKYLIERHDGIWEPGDVLVFRVKNALSAKHCGIVTADNQMIHAIWERKAQVTCIGAWADRLAGIFSFPGVE